MKNIKFFSSLPKMLFSSLRRPKRERAEQENKMGEKGMEVGVLNHIIRQ